MPLYEFKCKDCGLFELKRTFAEYSSTAECPTCGSVSKQQISSVDVFDSSPKTVGGLADKNTREMGRYELQDKRKAHKERGRAARRKLLEESGKLPKGATLPQVQEGYTPWYGNVSETNTEKINKMTDQQKADYIQKGTGL